MYKKMLTQNSKLLVDFLPVRILELCCHEIFGPGTYGPPRPFMSNIDGPLDPLCWHKWSGQNINGPGNN